MANCLLLLDLENQHQAAQSIINWYADFNFIKREYSIKNGINEDIKHVLVRDNITRVVILIGESTIYLDQSFKRDVEELSTSNISIICFNISGRLGVDKDNCPKFISSIGAVHMPLIKDDVVFTLKNLKENSRKEYRTGSYHMKTNFPNGDPSYY